MAGLPLIICLKSNSNKKYMRYEIENIQQHGLLKFAADKISDPLAQFEVLPSRTSDDLVHIKSRFNDKYLVRWSPNHYWISASAVEPCENVELWCCTLFRPIYTNDNDKTKIRLLHVQLNHFGTNTTIQNTNFDSYLFANQSKEVVNNDSTDVFTVIDWESLFNFPKHVTFKGDNGLYLGATTINNLPCLQFAYQNVDDPKVAHELFVNRPDGTVIMKSKYTNKFWRLSTGDWILTDGNDPRETHDTAGYFRPNIHDVNLVSFLNMSKTWYIKRYTTGMFFHCLNAVTQDVDDTAIIEIIDLESKSNNN